mmetsp:Transcript_110834/g.203235  ORF Transcript_110834/g.203235 Transcript_110834/m.203235 type:complete len:133 (-) Transcript_110834:233-631(-)
MSCCRRRVSEPPAKKARINVKDDNSILCLDYDVTLEVDGNRHKGLLKLKDVRAALGNHKEFFIVSRSDGSYIQGARNSGKLILEYQFGDDVKNHMEGDQDFTDADAISIITQYTTKGEDKWKKEYKWKKMPL